MAGTRLTVAIAGGGIAGLAAAIALARAGCRVTVYEQASEFAEVGAGLQLGPNGVKALDRLGAWEALEPAAVAPRRMVVGDGASGRTLAEFPLGAEFERRYGAPYRVAHRADLLTALLATAHGLAGVELNTAVRVEAVAWNGPRPVLRLASGDSAEVDAVVAADGLNSAVRTSLFGPSPLQRPGHLLYRTLVAIDAVPATAATDAVSLWLCPGGHVVHYPVSGGKRMNIVAAVQAPSLEEGWNLPAGAAEVVSAFAAAAPPLARLLAAAGEWRKWSAADRPPAPRWGSGAVTLIGDAAHPVLPYLAQGATMALEDAVVLGHCVAVGESPAQAFRAYEEARRPRTAQLFRLSRLQGRVYHLRGPLRLARNAVIAAVPSDVLLGRLDWLYGWQPPAGV